MSDTLTKICDGIYTGGPDNERSRIFVNATPDDGYPLRILQAYLADGDVYMTDNTEGEPPSNPLCVAMNEANEQRTEIVRQAIEDLLAGREARENAAKVRGTTP